MAIALAGMSLGGCAQFSRIGCGSCGNGLFQGHLKRLFNHKRAFVVSEGCEPGLAGPCDVMPGPGAIVPGPVIQAPAVEEVPALEPAPSSVVPSTGSATPTKRTLYETLKPNGGTTTSRRSGEIRSFATPESASRPAPAVADSSLAGDPLVNLPPVSAAIDPSREDAVATPPVAPPADEIQVAEPAKPDTPAGDSITTTNTAVPTPAESVELPVKPVEVPVSVAPGFKRFKVVDRQLAGGTVPTESGWAFLLEKGYKTVIDLRETSEVQAADVALAARSGFRYIPLPVTPQTLNAATLAKFQEEITLAGSRPLLFFDDNGARPAVMWYLKQVSIDKIDPADAAREAEEIGPRDTKYWLAAASLLEGAKVPGVAPAPADGDSTISVPTPAPGPDAPLPTSPATTSAETEFPVAQQSPESTPVADPTGWKPYAALMVAGLGLPVAYVSRSVLSYRPFAKASLPAPSRAAKAIASSSDA
jgi:protein tyrosine phosphatase (PTP) superfamily phosphohydrolase (DUF442 family)